MTASEAYPSALLRDARQHLAGDAESTAIIKRLADALENEVGRGLQLAIQLVGTVSTKRIPDAAAFTALPVRSVVVWDFPQTNVHNWADQKLPLGWLRTSGANVPTWFEGGARCTLIELKESD